MTAIQASTYTVEFNENGYENLTNLVNKNQYSTIFVLVDENTLEHCYAKFASQFATEKRIEIIQIDAGESFKNMDTCMGVWHAMADLGADRKSLLITLGGGVITDLGGFVAATFKRGINFINIPTTLLSMVDASVGGKTGVDLGSLKNQIGLFASPELVIIDPNYLDTLDSREIRSGSAEIIKKGLIYDHFLYDQIRSNPDLNLIDLIHRSIEIKNEVVLKDPKEKNIRKILNFGHTIGHAIESYFLENHEKENLTHGEAIAIGMICECYISSKQLGFPQDKLHEIKETITHVFGKVSIEEEDFVPIIELLKHDKKNLDGQVNFVLLENIEKFKLDCTANNDLIVGSFYYYNA